MPPAGYPSGAWLLSAEAVSRDLRFTLGGRQVEQSFLDVGCELVKDHYLAHAGLGNMSKSSKLDLKFQ